MAVYILKLAVDCFWYLAAVMPVIVSVSGFFGALLIAAPCLYVIVSLLEWKKLSGTAGAGGFLGQLQDHFLFQVKVLAVVLLVQLFVLKRASWERESAPFLVLFAVFGILMLRVSRVPESGRREPVFWLKNAGYLLGTAAAACLFSLNAVRDGAAAVVSGIYMRLALPVLLGILTLILKILEAVITFLARFFPAIEQLSLDAQMAEITADPMIPDGEFAQGTTPAALRLFFWVAAVAAVCALLFYIYRRLRLEEGTGKSSAGGTVRRERADGSSGDLGGGIHFLGKRDVRHYYRKFLKLCGQRGIRLDEQMTSGQIHEAARSCWEQEENLEKLRDLYRRARYGGEEEISPSGKAQEEPASRRARKLYRELKQEESVKFMAAP